jgi:hypothetical protein
LETRMEAAQQMKGYGVKMERLQPEEIAFLRTTVEEFRRKRS